MAGVGDPDTVDIVAQDTDGRCLLVIVEEGDWDGRKKARQLQEKIDSYLGRVLDGSVVRMYPELAGMQVRFRLMCREAVPAGIMTVIAKARSELDQLGIDFEVMVIPELGSPT